MESGTQSAEPAENIGITGEDVARLEEATYSSTLPLPDELREALADSSER